MKALTFHGWLAAGYHVKRGEKSRHRQPGLRGLPLFDRDQVEENEDDGPRDFDERDLYDDLDFDH